MPNFRSDYLTGNMFLYIITYALKLVITLISMQNTQGLALAIYEDRFQLTLSVL